MKKNLKLIFVIFSFFIFVSSVFGSEIKIKKGNQVNDISAINIRGIEYIPLEELSEILDANFYFNQTKQKAEIKFIDYNLKFTANNQFVILTDRKSNQHQIFQMEVKVRQARKSVL